MPSKKELEVSIKGKDNTGSAFSSFTENLTGSINKVKILGKVINITSDSIRKSIIEFGNVQKPLTEVTTLIDNVTNKTFGKLHDGIGEITTALGVDAVEATKALYQTISAGVRKDPFELLNVATRSAIAGVTDLHTAVDGLTTVMNAYQKSSIEFESMADQMFETVKLGKLRFEDLSQSMSTALPVAANLGIEFGDVMAATATLTKQGFSSAEAMIQIRSAIRSLLNPSKEMNKVFEALGVKSGRELLTTSDSLQDAFQKFHNVIGDNDPVLVRSLRRVEALQFVLGITGKNATTAAEDLQKIRSSTGSMNTAFEKMNEIRPLKVFWENIKKVGRDIGGSLLVPFQKLVAAFNDLVFGPTEFEKVAAKKLKKEFRELNKEIKNLKIEELQNKLDNLKPPPPITITIRDPGFKPIYRTITKEDSLLVKNHEKIKGFLKSRIEALKKIEKQKKAELAITRKLLETEEKAKELAWDMARFKIKDIELNLEHAELAAKTELEFRKKHNQIAIEDKISLFNANLDAEKNYQIEIAKINVNNQIAILKRKRDLIKEDSQINIALRHGILKKIREAEKANLENISKIRLEFAKKQKKPKKTEEMEIINLSGFDRQAQTVMLRLERVAALAGDKYKEGFIKKVQELGPKVTEALKRAYFTSLFKEGKDAAAKKFRKELHGIGTDLMLLQQGYRKTRDVAIDSFKEQFEKINEVAQAIGGAATSLMSDVSNMWMDSIRDKADALKEHLLATDSTLQAIREREAKAKGKDDKLAAILAKQASKREKEIAKEAKARLRGEFEDAKSLKMAIAVMNNSLGITNIWKDWSHNPVVAGILSAIHTAKMGVEMAVISAQKFHTGGLVGGSGEVPIIAQSGEGILNRGAMQNIGKEGLDSLNRGGGTGASDINIHLSFDEDSAEEFFTETARGQSIIKKAVMGFAT